MKIPAEFPQIGFLFANFSALTRNETIHWRVGNKQKQKPMTKKILTALIISTLLFSCGKSEEQKKIEQEKLEIHKQKVNVGKRKKITELNSILQNIPEAIKEAEKNIENVKMFKIGRLESTKNRQLNEAYEQLFEIEEFEKKLKEEIAQSEYLKTFDFQKDPKLIMQYIFESAKNGDISNFRYLCDPYGENDNDVNQICMAGLLNKKQKTELINMFKNGRIIGDPFYLGDQVQIEFAYGIGANRLEKMNMVKRNELWYLSGF